MSKGVEAQKILNDVIEVIEELPIEYEFSVQKARYVQTIQKDELIEAIKEMEVDDE